MPSIELIVYLPLVRPSKTKMEVPLSMAFGMSSESWFTHQTQYNMWHTEQCCEHLRVSKLAV